MPQESAKMTMLSILQTLQNLFPTRMSFVVFISYMALFINQGLLVTATKNADNAFNYNPVTVVLLTEIVKLIASSLIYLKENSFQKMISEIIKNKITFVKYFVPSFLYCLYNILSFVNLRSYDPTTYFLLLQFRVVVTAIIFQALFSKNLTRKQWISVLLLTFGCILKQQANVMLRNEESSKSGDWSSYLNFSLLLIGIQIMSSCVAGVYNEYLLKKDDKAHIMLQNVFMYTDSIICNAFILSIYTPEGQETTGLVEAFSLKAIAPILLDFKVVLVVLNLAAIGIVTSLFLKNLNSILKSFASALELMFTGVLSWIIFGIAIDFWTLVSIMIVSYAIWLYAQNPVVNTTQQQQQQKQSKDIEDEKASLEKRQEMV